MRLYHRRVSLLAPSDPGVRAPPPVRLRPGGPQEAGLRPQVQGDVRCPDKSRGRRVLPLPPSRASAVLLLLPSPSSSALLRSRVLSPPSAAASCDLRPISHRLPTPPPPLPLPPPHPVSDRRHLRPPSLSWHPPCGLPGLPQGPPPLRGGFRFRRLVRRFLPLLPPNPRVSQPPPPVPSPHPRPELARCAGARKGSGLGRARRCPGRVRQQGPHGGGGGRRDEGEGGDPRGQVRVKGPRYVFKKGFL
mmetsp:Transcript_1112/g.2488  ORF Transcript_1112/g.2488 Transcript_1112/m.2488 type:complete len:247 (-) Transcript_1112:60-800(-)